MLVDVKPAQSSETETAIPVIIEDKP